MQFVRPVGVFEEKTCNTNIKYDFLDIPVFSFTFATLCLYLKPRIFFFFFFFFFHKSENKMATDFQTKPHFLKFWNYFGSKS